MSETKTIQSELSPLASIDLLDIRALPEREAEQMTDAELQAYEWATSQVFQSVAARNARTLRSISVESERLSND